MGLEFLKVMRGRQRLIQNLKLNIGDKNFRTLVITPGTRQEDRLSPLVFNFILDGITHEWENQNKSVK